MKKYLIIIVLMFGFTCTAQVRDAVKYTTVNFNASATSDVLSIDRGASLKAILIPQGLTAVLKFKVSNDGTTFYDLADSSHVLSYGIDSTKAIGLALPNTWFKSWKYWKFVADNAKAGTVSVIAVTGN